MAVSHSSSAPRSALAGLILEQVEQLIRTSQDENKPLEVEPFRSRLFEVFVTAEAAGLVAEEAEPDLTADGLCRALSERWGLKAAAEAALHADSRFSTYELRQMRSLWSVMRMWMEWSYAWRRWPEFHQHRHETNH